jgi:hypothetical protein
MKGNGMQADSSVSSPGAEGHFRLYFYSVVTRLLAQMHADTRLAGLLEQFPFLAGYQAALEEYSHDHQVTLDILVSGERETNHGWWEEQIGQWEAGTREHLPLKALVAAGGYDADDLHVLIAVGMVEEDVRFGTLYAALQDPVRARRPCIGLLGWLLGWEMPDAWAVCRRLLEAGFLTTENRSDTRAEWLLRVPGAVWDALRGRPQRRPHPLMQHQPAVSFPRLEELILPASLQTQISRVPYLLANRQIETLVLRGMAGSGRRTTLGAIARSLGRDILLCQNGSLAGLDEESRTLLTPLTILTSAIPVLRCDPAPGEALELAALPGYPGPVGVTIGRHGGLKGALMTHALTLTLPPPDAEARRRFWLATNVAIAEETLPLLANDFLLTGGVIHKVATLGASYAALDSRAALRPQDAQQALRAFNRQALETLATPLDPIGDRYGVRSSHWSAVVVSEALLEELAALEARCRGRESLRTQAGHAFRHTLNRGVRAMFGGPSGTGKTLAARALAGALELDIYRVDLAAVVNKYIGETERNLNQLFSRAEELNVVLLLDEGDALMARRTDVSNANDRYANLETNYLLQRLESYEGIVIITTNAAQRIDSAFLRRLDMVIEFSPPDVTERWRIWQVHLPGNHGVSRELLEDVAARCILTGGQIRNAALHATLLALGQGVVVGDTQVEAALQREYRKAGAAFPLRTRRNGQGQMDHLRRFTAQLG